MRTLTPTLQHGQKGKNSSSHAFSFGFLQREKFTVYPSITVNGKCGAFLQSCPDTLVPHVENLSNWTGSEVPGAQGKTVGQRSEREMDEVTSKEACRGKRG